MSKLRIAVLEDKPEQLKYIVQLIRETNLVEVVGYSNNSKDFITKVAELNPDALFMDIDLDDGNLNGLEIANLLKRPVLFLSGKTTQFFKELEDLDGALPDMPVKQITKPITKEKLMLRLPKFIDEVKLLSQKSKVSLTFLNTGRDNIPLSSIVYLTSIGEDSNNKTIFFDNRPPEILIDFSFTDMGALGFTDIFVMTHRQYRVNKKKIITFKDSNSEIIVTVSNHLGEIIKKNLPVSENYRSKIKKLI